MIKINQAEPVITFVTLLILLPFLNLASLLPTMQLDY